MKCFKHFVVRPPRLFRLLYPEAIWRVKKEEEVKTVYLTFDDGPNEAITEFILGVLRCFDVKATFFVVGENVERHPELLRALLDEGHSIGNHTMHHLNGRNIRNQSFIADVEAQEVLMKTSLFRPPHGYMSRSQYRALKKDYRIVMFDLVTRDYAPEVSADDILMTVKKYVRDGSVIVFHDSVKSFDKLKAALPATLQWLKSEGYECRRLEMER